MQRPHPASAPLLGAAPTATRRSAGAVTLAALLLAACGRATQSPSTGGAGPDAAADSVVAKSAPRLEAVDHNGAAVSTVPSRGFTLVYFYPKDATPGCTKEACAVRDVWARFEAAGVSVIGVSTDDAQSHRAFAEEHKLPFSLVADTDKVWCDAFGVKTTMGFASRVSFLIDANGVIVREYPDVDPGVHATQVLDDVAALTAGT